jgi:enoyl-CoA hydratase/carnithine racemase
LTKVQYEKRDRIAYVPLNPAPRRRTRSTPEMHELLVATWADFRDDDAVDVAIVTGAGDAFCSART